MHAEHDVRFFELVRDTIAANGSKFASAEFIKKDGTVRRIRFQASHVHAKRMVGSPRGIQAAQTRRVNHPHLVNVAEILSKPDPDGKTVHFRTINTDTMRWFKVGGEIFHTQRIAL